MLILKLKNINSPNFLEDVVIYNVVVSNKIFFGEKNYTLLVNSVMIIKLSRYIMLSKGNTYVKNYDNQANRMSFLIEDYNFLEK